MIKNYIFVFCIFMILLEKAHARIIYDFSSDKSVNDWVVIDDGVMGGVSYGSINLDDEGNGLYKGNVSLENYGGFSSIRLRQKEIDVASYKHITLKVFGDNKFYQLRIKSRYYDRHVYAKEFYAEPYGWGGGYECRDCSATTRDFLGAFGIFLRRNSSKQAEDGHSINIKGLSKSKKKKTIISDAEPFRSLLYVPGHIALYLGQYKGEPVIMHTYWGIRKNDKTKLITGRTVITTTEPGKERDDVREWREVAIIYVRQQLTKALALMGIEVPPRM